MKNTYYTKCKPYFLFILFFSLPILKSYSQEQFKVGFIAGINGSQISGDTYAGYNQPGIYSGLFVRSIFSHDIELSFEVCYSQKGSRHNPNPERGDYSQYVLRLNYISIPISFSFPISYTERIRPQLGLGINVLIDYYEEVNYFNQSNSRPFKPLELSAYAGIIYRINTQFDLHLRAESSVLPVRDHLSGTSFRMNLGQYNALLCFALSYKIGKNKE